MLVVLVAHVCMQKVGCKPTIQTPISDYIYIYIYIYIFLFIYLFKARPYRTTPYIYI